MKNLFTSLLVAGFVLLSAHASDVDEKDVVVLTDKNFDGIVKKSKFALVEFYAPWCGHCKSLKAPYAEAATKVKEIDEGIVLGKVDATEEKELGGKFEIKGYPTLKWFVDGELHSDYNGPRDAAGITSWIKKKTGPPADTVSDADALSSLEKKNEVIVVGYFKEFSGDEYAGFVKTASKIEDVTFVQTTDKNVAEKAGLKSAPAVGCIKNFAGEAREVAALEKDITAENVETFVNGEKLPLTIEFTKDSAQKIFNSGINLHMIVWATGAELKADSKLMKAIKPAAKEFKGKVIFVTANNEGEDAGPITKHFGLEDSPTVLGFVMEKNKKFKFTGEYTEADIKKFTQSVVDGTAVADYKSAEIPKDDQDEGVTVVVGKSFEKIVMDKTKDVLLEVYAPWCGHCKKLAPIYVDLAKRFKDVDSVVIAKFDATENEHELVDAKGFPTLLFYPSGEDKTPIPFAGGDRSLEALTAFIKETAKSSFTLPDVPEEEEEYDDEYDEEKNVKDEL